MVYFSDFFLFADQFETKISDSNWDSRYDLKPDGKINWDDFTIFADHFGERQGKAELAKLIALAEEWLNGSSEFKLLGNYPNPFNAQTTIAYKQPAEVEGNCIICIHNASGQLVKTFVDGRQQDSHHTVKWDGTDKQGRQVSSGIYFYTIKIRDMELLGKMTLTR